MFERFTSLFERSAIAGPADAGNPPAGARSGIGELAGVTFRQGLYRLHTSSSAAAADLLVADAYPDFAGRVACFGMDWLGRQFSLDPTRGRAADPEVLMYEVGTGEALEIPTAFSTFHDVELVDYTDAALASTFFDRWAETSPAPIRFDQCVGYRVPLFLGGADDLSNLSVADLDVYWTVTGQLRTAVLGTP